jgi:hypothetical protein
MTPEWRLLPFCYGSTMTVALLCAILAILSNRILAGAIDNPVSILQNPVLSHQFTSHHVEIARTFSAASNRILAGAIDNPVSILQNPVLSHQFTSHHVEIARTFSAATYPLLEHDRYLQSSNFQIFCDLVEASGPFDCECDAVNLIAVCNSSETCNIDTCATFDTVNTFDTDFNLVSAESCVEYTREVADYRDGCSKLTIINDGQIFDTCEISFVDDIGKLTACNDCLVCNGSIDSLTLDLECSNVEAEASTAGCISVEDDTAFFPGFGNGAPSASDGPPVGLVLAGSAVATLFLGLHIF